MVQLEASLQLLQFIEQLPPIKHENPLLRSLRLVCVCVWHTKGQARHCALSEYHIGFFLISSADGHTSRLIPPSISLSYTPPRGRHHLQDTPQRSPHLPPGSLELVLQQKLPEEFAHARPISKTRSLEWLKGSVWNGSFRRLGLGSQQPSEPIIESLDIIILRTPPRK